MNDTSFLSSTPNNPKCLGEIQPNRKWHQVKDQVSFCNWIATTQPLERIAISTTRQTNAFICQWSYKYFDTFFYYFEDVYIMSGVGVRVFALIKWYIFTQHPVNSVAYHLFQTQNVVKNYWLNIKNLESVYFGVY